MKPYVRLIAVLAVLGLVLAACGSDNGEATTTAGETTTTAAPVETTTTGGETTTTGAVADAVSVCLVTDLAGVDDRSFNAAAWQGVLDAVDAGAAAADPLLLESDAQDDYQPNIDQCISQGAQHIVTVGFELADATISNAEANTDITWTIVDFPIDLPNVRGLVYQTDEAAFAAGYLAAGVSTSGTIGTYGGLNIPSVAIFMDGLAKGVAHYNEVKGASVRVIGWDVDRIDGNFTGTFDPAKPQVISACQSLLDEGADIILPVGGAINLPCGTEIQSRNIDAALIGVDQDAFLAAPAEYQDLWLTTIEKGIAIQVMRSIQDHAAGTWTAGIVNGTLENEGVGLSEYHSWSDKVPDDLAAEVDQILADIASGAIDFPRYAPAPE